MSVSETCGPAVAHDLALAEGIQVLIHTVYNLSYTLMAGNMSTHWCIAIDGMMI